jgi:hypothetical protein
MNNIDVNEKTKGSRDEYIFTNTVNGSMNILKLKFDESVEDAIVRLKARGWDIPEGTVLGQYKYELALRKPTN